MKLLKIVGILFSIYIAIVVIFESLLGYFQPANQDTLVITTLNDEGEASHRVLRRLEVEDKIYVAANHWPRNWYSEALDNPNVGIKIEDETKPYLAVPINNEEYQRVNTQHALPLGFKILTGFPPRYILRLDPKTSDPS